MRWICLSLSLVSLTVSSWAGGMGNDGLQSDAESNNNIWGISRLTEGMSEAEVMRIMGKPYDYQTFSAEEDVYDIWFYITMPTVLGQTRMVHQNLTPLTFKNGALVGWGYHLYEKALAAQKVAEQKAARSVAPANNETEIENKEVEKVLQTPPKTPKTAPQPPKKVSQTSQLPGREPKQDEPSNLKIKSWEPKNPNAKKNQQTQPEKTTLPANPNQKPQQATPSAPSKNPKTTPPTQNGTKTPQTAPPAQNGNKPISMSSSPKEKTAPPEPEPKPEKPEPFDDPGNRMLEDADEEDFNVW